MEVDQRVKPWTRMLAVGLVQRARSGTPLEVRFANGLHAGSEKRELTQDDAWVFGLIHCAPLAEMGEDSGRRDLGKKLGVVSSVGDMLCLTACPPSTWRG